MASTAKDLVKRMASDRAFKTAVEVAGTKEARLAFLAKNGFGDVTAADIKALAKQQGTELTDAQLEAVAGGKMVEWIAVAVAAAALL